MTKDQVEQGLIAIPELKKRLGDITCMFTDKNGDGYYPCSFFSRLKQLSGSLSVISWPFVGLPSCRTRRRRNERPRVLQTRPPPLSVRPLPFSATAFSSLRRPSPATLRRRAEERAAHREESINVACPVLQERLSHPYRQQLVPEAGPQECPILRPGAGHSALSSWISTHRADAEVLRRDEEYCRIAGSQLLGEETSKPGGRKEAP